MMFTINPFAELSVSIPPAVTQTYVVIMIVLVAAGTLFDIVHKGSARYFFDNWRKSKSKGQRQISGAEWVSLAVKTGLVDVLASGEFCSARRRTAPGVPVPAAISGHPPSCPTAARCSFPAGRAAGGPSGATGHR